MYFVKVREPLHGLNYYDYGIRTSRGKLVCVSELPWKTRGGAIRAAKKIASDLGIEYRD